MKGGIIIIISFLTTFLQQQLFSQGELRFRAAIFSKLAPKTSHSSFIYKHIKLSSSYVLSYYLHVFLGQVRSIASNYGQVFRNIHCTLGIGLIVFVWNIKRLFMKTDTVVE